MLRGIFNVFWALYYFLLESDDMLKFSRCTRNCYDMKHNILTNSINVKAKRKDLSIYVKKKKVNILVLLIVLCRLSFGEDISFSKVCNFTFENLINLLLFLPFFHFFDLRILFLMHGRRSRRELVQVRAWKYIIIGGSYRTLKIMLLLYIIIYCEETLGNSLKKN